MSAVSLSSLPSSRLTVSLAQHLIASGTITKQQLVLYCHALAVAGEQRWGLNAFTKIFDKEYVLEQCDASAGPLAGIPVSIKAIIAVKEAPLTASSKILATDEPCGYDATVVSKLRSAGAVVIGKTQMDEFGMGSLGSNPGEGHLPSTRNPLPYLGTAPFSLDNIVKQIQQPYDLIIEQHSDQIAQTDEWLASGGSSSGSAASVAHGSSLLSLGSDTGGSVRLPAAWCGVVGLKPSYGLLSRHGLVSYASSLDTIGIIAPSVPCAALALNHMLPTGEGSTRDSTLASQQVKAIELGGTVEGLKIGLPAAFSLKECPGDVHQQWLNAVDVLDRKGATIVEIPEAIISSDLIRTSLGAYYVLASAEASSNLSRYDGLRYGSTAAALSSSPDMTELEKQYSATRSEGFGHEVARRILCGTSVLSSDRFHTHYEAAAKVRATVCQQLTRALQDDVDALLLPTCLIGPPKLGPSGSEIDPTVMFANDVMTVPASLAGLPAVTSNSGIQIIGRRLEEGTILSLANALQSV